MNEYASAKTIYPISVIAKRYSIYVCSMFYEVIFGRVFHYEEEDDDYSPS
jgi:hypothetical protein